MHLTLCPQYLLIEEKGDLIPVIKAIWEEASMHEVCSFFNCTYRF